MKIKNEFANNFTPANHAPLPIRRTGRRTHQSVMVGWVWQSVPFCKANAGGNLDWGNTPANRSAGYTPLLG